MAAASRLFRDVGNVTMDLNGVEKIQLNALGGADTITVNDLTGTGVTQVAIDLGATAGSPGGDGQRDTVIVNGTQAADHISVVNSGGSIVVKGLAAQVSIANAEAGDALIINGLGGDDVIDASAIKAGQVQLTLNGGDGNDQIIGSAGDDLVNGGRGNDVALMGAGNDTFVWNPGDGSDTVEGQSGTDTLQFNGANINENIDISANGSRARLFRDVGNVTMDLNGVENINVGALGGADTITVNDLTGTAVKQVAIDLSARRAAASATARPTPSSSTRPTATTSSPSPKQRCGDCVGARRGRDDQGLRCAAIASSSTVSAATTSSTRPASSRASSSPPTAATAMTS